MIKTDKDIMDRYKSLSTGQLPNLTQIRNRKRVQHDTEYHAKTKLKLERVQPSVCDLVQLNSQRIIDYKVNDYKVKE